MLGRGRERNVPETVDNVAVAADDDFSLFDYIDVVFGEEGNAIVVAKLADGNERTGLEVIKYVAGLGG